MLQQPVENALTQSRTQNAVNEITDISRSVGADWPTPDYDANGNTTSFPDPRSLTSDLTATYDAWNRLVKLADASGTVAEYQYDGLGRRTEKTVGGTTRHAYFSDQWQVLEERVGSSTSADQQFLWGQRYVDDLVLRDRGSQRLYSLSDALFNVVALTDDTGDVKERFAYQPYGQSEALNEDFTLYSDTDYEWEYRFTGRELDLESGLQINRYRYLHLQLGRWVNRDPVFPYDRQQYQYCNGNPLTMVDPYGLQIEYPIAPPIPWREILIRLGRLGAIPWWLWGAALLAWLAWRLYVCLPKFQACKAALGPGNPFIQACAIANRTKCQFHCLPGTMRRYDRNANLACNVDSNQSKCLEALLFCMIGFPYSPAPTCDPECDLIGCHCNKPDLACGEDQNQDQNEDQYHNHYTVDV